MISKSAQAPSPLQNPSAEMGRVEELVTSLPVATICFDVNGGFICANIEFQALVQGSSIDFERLSKDELCAQLESGRDLPSLTPEVGVFGAKQAPAVELSQLSNGRVVELLERTLKIEGVGEYKLQQWVDHTPMARSCSETESEMRLLLELINQVPDQIYFKDVNSRFTRINPSLAKRYGIASASEALGKSDADYYSKEHAQQTRAEELEIMRTAKPVFNQMHHEVWDDGSESWNISTKMPMFNSKGEVVGVTGISHDITEHKRREADAWRQANYDSLTTLANRNYFLQQLSARLTHAKHTGGHFAVMLLDLDQFKEVNDSLGHSQGDSLLVHVAQRLVHVLRDTDLVGRLGGDEFAIIVEFSTIEQLDPLLTRLLSEIEQPVDLHQAQVSVSASIGVAVFPDDGDTPGELLSHADEAMYHVKGRGRAGYSFYSSELSELTKRRLRLASDLRAAICTEQISVVYQPVVSAHYNRIVGAEALCRWSHPELGEIPPSEFIPLAEQTGLIQRLEDWILDTVLQQLVQINNLNVSPVRISVNISPLRIMREPKRLSELAAELDSLGVYPSQLVIEVTEGLLLEATEEVLELFDILNKQGLVISLDDFGTGYCALSYLMHLNIQQVKIDRSFVERIDIDANSQALCASIISLAKTLGLSAVAEGVEEEVQRDLLSGLGCDYYQGFLFSKPLKPEVLMQKLAEQRQHEELVLTGESDSANL